MLAKKIHKKLQKPKTVTKRKNNNPFDKSNPFIPAANSMTIMESINAHAGVSNEPFVAPIRKIKPEDKAAENELKTVEPTEENSVSELKNEAIVTPEIIVVDVPTSLTDIQTQIQTIDKESDAENQELLTNVIPANEVSEPEEKKEHVTENSQVYIQSLTHQKPTSFMADMKGMDSNLSEVLSNEKTSLEESLPVIEQPTGIPLKAKAKKAIIKNKVANIETQIRSNKSTLPDLKPTGKDKGEKIEEISVQPTSVFDTVGGQLSQLGKQGTDQERKEELKQGVSQLPTAENVNTSAGVAPNVDLEGKADPNKNQQNSDASAATTNKEHTKNQLESQLDKGENDIYPEMELELLSPTVEFSAIQPTASLTDEIPVVSDEIRESFDASAQEYMDAEMAPEMQKQDEAYIQMQEEQEEERLNSDEAIALETDTIKKEQEAAQKTAKADVNTQRTAWQKENNAVKNDFTAKSDAEKTKIDNEIDTKITETDTEISIEYDAAETQADKEVAKTNTEAEAQKTAAESNTKEKSWWDKAIDAVGDFFDKLKEGLNKLFDGLRSLVKTIIEKAKKLANALIDMARDAIVGMIEGFGELLKSIVNIALAAFPKLRDKFNALIDSAVSIAVNVVNTLAEGLKKAVNALLDLLGAALDAILAVYQAVFNAILDVMKFLTVGLIEIMRGLANLVSSAMEMPPNFWGQISEEFLGMDVTKPLPFERETPYVLENQLAVDPALSDYLGKSEYQESDFVVDNMTNDLQVSDEIMSQILGMPENGDLTFGENNQETMSHLDGISDIIAGSQQGTGEEEMVMPTEYYGKPEPQIDWFIGEQGKKPPITDVPDTADGKEAASQSDIPAPMRILEPLSVGNRLYYMRTQMMGALKKKWEENKVKYIVIGTLVVLAITALAIVTGGAIFGLIPPALQIFAAIMAGQALLKAGSFFSDYLTEGWAGKIAQGGKNLARAIGILLVELIFILLFDLSALLKVLKAGAKGAVKMAVKSTKATFNALGTAAKATGKGLLKTGTKVVTGVKGIGKGIGKGAKTLDDFAKKMLKKGRFKGFKITRKGKWFQLYASVNPWVLLASGEIVEVKNKGGVKVGQKGKFKPTKGGKAIDGILVGGTKNKSKFVEAIDDLKIKSPKKHEKLIEEVNDILNNKSTKSIDDLFKLRNQGTRELRKTIPGKQPKFFQAHHIIPRETRKIFDDFFKKIGFDIEKGAINGIMVPPSDKILKEAQLDDVIKIGSEFDNYAKHLGSHPDYTDIVTKKLFEIRKQFFNKNLNLDEALDAVIGITNDAKDAIKTAGSEINLNDLIF